MQCLIGDLGLIVCVCVYVHVEVDELACLCPQMNSWSLHIVLGGKH